MRIIISFVVSLCISAAVFAQSITNQDDLNKIAGDIAGAIKANYGFVTGSGNYYSPGVRQFPGLRIGVGAGVAGNASLFTVFNNGLSTTTNILDAFKLLPGVYDMVYGKVGLFDLPLIGLIDVGGRLGYFPKTTFTLPGGYGFTVDNFAFGLEVRRKMLDEFGGLLKLDIRASIDVNSGSIALGYSNTVSNVTLTVTNTMAWTGSSFGVKAVGGISIPFLGTVYAGIGPNINVGSVKDTINVNGSGELFGTVMNLPGLNASGTASYDAFDIRALAGVHLFVLDVAVEYGLLSKGICLSGGVSFFF
ncbi:MAG: hypothetical protein HZC28_19820 [Spirochaetes bacterium]|nr:hypothetical protein [Spirochaetota bacterium]